MSKLNVDQKTIMLLFSDKKSDFLIPDYQRPRSVTFRFTQISSSHYIIKNFALNIFMPNSQQNNLCQLILFKTCQS
jgi:hypothetical protein